jgi:hypothetical protein
MNFLIIDFYKAASNKVCLGDIIFSDCNYLTEGSRNYTFQLLIVGDPHHCVSLSATSLSVCEYGSIVPVKNAVNEREGTLFIY